MDFAGALQELDEFLRAQNSRFAVIGGMALQAYGRGRSTFDLDLVVPRSVQDSLVLFLVERDYETLHVSEGYSNHLRANPPSRLDFVYVDEKTEAKVFARTEARLQIAGRSYLVPHPEHLIAMKVVAMKNDRSRRFQDLADIAFLMQLPGVDTSAVRSYFERHQLLGDFDELERSN